MTRTGVSRHEAEQLLQRAHSDPAWLARLRAAYRGRHDVLDALWWAAHPLTESPRGAADPAAETLQLQRAVFSRAAEETPRLGVADPISGERVRMNADELRLRELQAAFARDTTDLVKALEQVAEPEPAIEAAASADVSEPAPALLVPQHADASPPKEIDSPRRTRVIAILTAIVLAAVVLPGIPGVVAGIAGSSPEPSSPPEASLPVVPLSAGGHVQPPLKMLADSSQEIDSPIRAMGVLEPMRNFRALPTITEHSAWYLANGEDDEICLLAMTVGGTAMTRCIPQAEFEEDGISLGMTGTYILDTGITRTVEQELFRLGADGSFSYGALVIDAARRPH